METAQRRLSNSSILQRRMSDGSYASVSTRERWSSRAAFYFAAIGSAVGFGNVWRFPSLVYEYGGGAFFIPYVLALLFVGLPILVLEISLGQYYETGDVNVFGGIHRRLRGVGLCSIACGYMLVTYYSMLIAWVANAFFDSFSSDNFWAQDQVTGSEAKAYFYNEIIGMSTLGSDLLPTRLVGKNVGYSLLVWVIIYLCIAFGIKVTGRITYFTMGLPIILLFVFLGRALTLPGSELGVNEYIGYSNWEVLTQRPEVWTKAVAQIFFSLSITFGIMTAYGSHCHRTEPAFKNSCVVAVSNSLFSFVAGFAVFAALGHLAFIENMEDLSQLEYSSFGLVFGSWPVVMGTLPGGKHWIRLLFFMLFLLGIDSAFSFNEGFLIGFDDVPFFKKIDKKYASAILTLTAWLLSFTYATDAGLIFLDTIDYYVNFVMLLIGGFECFAAGWVYNIEEQIDSVGANIVFAYMFTTFGSITLACCLWFAISDSNDAVWIGLVGLGSFYTFGMAVVLFMMYRKIKEDSFRWSWRSMLYDLFLRNVMDLREDLAGVVGYIPYVWAFLIKHFIPPVIIFLFALGCSAETASGETEFGHYSGYPTAPYQILGIFTVVFAGFLFLSSAVFPQMYNALQKLDSPVKKSRRNSLSQNPVEGLEDAARTMWQVKRPTDKLSEDEDSKGNSKGNSKEETMSNSSAIFIEE